ncbi:MAG: 2-phospho-L-lactate transferase [Frankiales bacterium]|nr:2-phospho-L-lactate transferase [Frankiales bacterium]
MRITVLAGGIGGARFLRGLLRHLDASAPGSEVTVVGNTGDDIRLFGLQVCPDLDSVMYTLGGGISEERGWGREDETFTVKEELAAYGVEPTWFGLGDRDTATHLVRSQMLAAGYPLSAVTAALCDRWRPGVRLLPMSDDRLETHVVVDGDEPGTRRALHFQEWWIRHRAALPAREFVLVGLESATPAPGVLEAISDTDVVLLSPSNPVVSLGTILQVPGVRDAVRTTSAPVVGLSPIVGGAPVRGMADACLSAIGVETTAAAVARHYGARTAEDGSDAGGLLDGWLVHSPDDDGAVDELAGTGIAARAAPLLMTDLAATAAMAAAALDLAQDVRR